MWNEEENEYIDYDISCLVGKTLSNVVNVDDEIIFTVSEDEVYKLYHRQDCCENVRVEDICGDLEDLVGTQIVVAEEVSNEPEPYNPYKSEEDGGSGYGDSYTWTFYKFRTMKGTVTIRFLGTSNGYYSERVDFDRVK